MRLLLSTTILLLSTTFVAGQDAVPAQVSVQPTVPTTEPSSSTAPSQNKSVAKAFTMLQRSTGMAADDLQQQMRQTVLVVPTTELSPQALAAVSEDMAVMCRILDKAVAPGARTGTSYMYAGTGNDFSVFFGGQTQRIQGLYLDGYGALFFVRVDFPLVAPQQQKPEAQPEESGDRVWSDTMKELQGQPQQAAGAGEAGPAYDAQKVDNLKTTLIETLRHAANLRLRTPQEVIIVAVGTQNDGVAYGSKQLFSTNAYGGPVATLPTIKGKQRIMAPGAFTPDPAATLILRVSKADVDAFAAGNLTPEQFTPKVRIIWPPATQSQPQEAAPR